MCYSDLREVLKGRLAELETLNAGLEQAGAESQQLVAVAEKEAGASKARAVGLGAEKGKLVEDAAGMKDRIEGLEAQLAGFVEELDTTLANSPAART